MTPQERQRVTDLFNRLAQLENAPREREAEQLVAEGLRFAPNAPYALVQTVLIQEEALARANDRVRELEAQLGVAEPAQSGGGFLDSLRGALSGQPVAPRRGSVPATRQGGQPMGVPPGFRQSAAPAAGQRQEIGRGGSFLGQAASIAAGVVVGSMVVDALRGQFGSQAESGADAKASEAQQASASDQDQGREEPGSYETADAGDTGGDFDGGDFGGGGSDFG
ncbi:MAG: DUF2076 domain-containing protein [Xanthobacteraceae bacterium]